MYQYQHLRRKIMSKKTAIITVVAVVLIATSMVYTKNVSAQSNTTSYFGKMNMHRGLLDHMPGVFGEVTNINGNIITITNKKGISYDIDASTAKIMKDRDTDITLAEVKIGDSLMVLGTVSGNSVTANTIFDGLKKFDGTNVRNLRGIAGKVSSVSGTNITVTGKNGTNYIVDATNADVIKIAGKTKTTTSILDLTVGDTVLIKGTVTDTNVVATKVIDGEFSKRPMRFPHGWSGNFGKKN